jgi:hypothetical protein
LAALPVLAMLVAAGDLFIAGATSETRAGEQPINPGQAPEAFVAEVLTPTVGVRLRDRADLFSLFYAPRILFQQPNAANNQWAPLVMHTGRLGLTTAFSRRLGLTLNVDASYGKPDYATLTNIFGTNGALPNVATIVSVGGQATLRFVATRRLELSLGASVFHYDEPGVSTTPPPPMPGMQMPPTVNGRVIVQQTAAGLQPVFFYRLSPAGSLVFDTAAAVTSYYSDVQILTGHATTGFRLRLSRVRTMTLTIGISYVRDIGATPFLAPGLFPLAPAGEFRLDTRLSRQGITALFSRVGARVDYSVDPVLGTATPRAVVYGRLTMVVDPDWMFAPEADFGTSLRTTPYVMTGSTDQNGPDETAFNVLLPARRRLSANAFMEIGARWSDRAPTLSAPDFHFHQRQLYGYFSLTVTTLPARRAIATTP